MKNIQFNDAFPPVDARFERSIERALALIRSRKGKERKVRRNRVMLIAAMLAVLLATVALAAGIIQLPSSRMISEGYAGDPTTDYQKVEDLADVDLCEQSVIFDSGSQALVRLEQSYYNGEQLILGLAYAGSDAVEFYQRGDPRYEKVQPRQIETVVDGHVNLEVMDIRLENHFPSDVEAELHKRLNADGWVGLYWQEIWLGDGLYIPNLPNQEKFWDGTIIDAPHTRLRASTDRDWNVVGAGQRYIEIQTPLPTAILNRESITIMLEVYSRPTWCCWEETPEKTEIYIGYGDTEVKELYFNIPINGVYFETNYREEAEFPNYTATISMTATPVYAQIHIVNHLPPAWVEAWSEHEGKYILPLNLAEDVAFDYRIFVERGSILKPLEVALDDGEGVGNLSGRFVIPDGATAVVLRPIYANSGEHPDEDFRIELNS